MFSHSNWNIKSIWSVLYSMTVIFITKILNNVITDLLQSDSLIETHTQICTDNPQDNLHPNLYLRFGFWETHIKTVQFLTWCPLSQFLLLQNWDNCICSFSLTVHSEHNLNKSASLSFGKCPQEISVWAVCLLYYLTSSILLPKTWFILSFKGNVNIYSFINIHSFIFSNILHSAF